MPRDSPAGNDSGSRPVAIAGAGLGGLSAAIHLRLAGRQVTVFEKNALSGGRANLLEQDGFRFDTGPSLVNYPWVFEDLFRSAAGISTITLRCSRLILRSPFAGAMART